MCDTIIFYMVAKNTRKHDEDPELEEKLETLDEFMHENGSSKRGSSYARVRRGGGEVPEVPLAMYRKIAIGFIALTGILLLIMLVFTATSATITITPKKETITNTLLRTVNGVADKIDGAVVIDDVEISNSFSVSQGKEIEGYARGKITVINTSSEPYSFIPKTRFKSKNGIIFRMTKRADIPAKGKIVVDVVADVKGAMGEIVAGKFSIPGLSLAKQEFVYGESNTPMQGGVRVAGVLTETDVSQAEKEIIKALTTKQSERASQSEEAKKYPDSLTSVEFLTKTIDAKIGSEIDGFTFTGKVRVATIFFNGRALDTLTRQAVFAKVPEGMRLDTVGDPRYEVEKIDATAKTATLRLIRDGIVLLDPTSSLVAPSHFTGNTKEEIETYLKNTNHVEAWQIQIRPRWRSKTPANEERIKVKIEAVQ